MDDHVRFSGTKYEKGNKNKNGNHYKCGAHRQRAAVINTHTVVKSCVFSFSAELDPQTPTSRGDTFLKYKGTLTL